MEVFMKSKIAKKLLASAIAISLACASVTASAATVRNPNPNGQNKTLWCWAASSKIVAEHNGGQNPSISRGAQKLANTSGLHSTYYGINSSGNYTADGVQHNIVKKVKGNDSNASAGDSEKFQALQYASANTMSIGNIGTYGQQLSAAQLSQLQNDLNNGKYVIGNMALQTGVDSNGNPTYAGHSVVIKSYRTSDNSYRIFDPWDLTEINYREQTVFVNYNFPVGNYNYRIEWLNYCH